jgi:hypothetical protein
MRVSIVEVLEYAVVCLADSWLQISGMMTYTVSVPPATGEVAGGTDTV